MTTEPVLLPPYLLRDLHFARLGVLTYGERGKLVPHHHFARLAGLGFLSLRVDPGTIREHHVRTTKPESARRWHVAVVSLINTVRQPWWPSVSCSSGAGSNLHWLRAWGMPVLVRRCSPPRMRHYDRPSSSCSATRKDLLGPVHPEEQQDLPRLTRVARSLLAALFQKELAVVEQQPRTGVLQAAKQPLGRSVVGVYKIGSGHSFDEDAVGTLVLFGRVFLYDRRLVG